MTFSVLPSGLQEYGYACILTVHTEEYPKFILASINFDVLHPIPNNQLEFQLVSTFHQIVGHRFDLFTTLVTKSWTLSWNALRSSKLVCWYIIIVLIHSFTQWHHMTLAVIFKVIDIGYNTYRADLGQGYLRVTFERFCPRTYYFLNSHWMKMDRRFIWENISKL